MVVGIVSGTAPHPGLRGHRGRTTTPAHLCSAHRYRAFAHSWWAEQTSAAV